MSNKIYTIGEIKQFVTPIAVKYDVDRVYIFGSYARGTASPESDLDFIIDKGRLRGLGLAGMLGDLQDNFNKDVDLLTSSCLAENWSNISFNQKTEKDMVIVYEQ